MNIYSYFQKIDKECKSVPSKNNALYNWVVFKTKFAALAKPDAFEVINWASEKLQEDEFVGATFKDDVISKINGKKKNFILRELSDFGLYLFVYITVLTVLYENVASVLFEGANFNFNLDVTTGFIIQIIGVYLSFKLLVYFLARNPNRSSIIFWLELACLFGLYMYSNYLNTVCKLVLFQMPVLLWVLISMLLLIISIQFVKKEKII